MMKKSLINNLFIVWAILSGSILFAQTVKGVVSDESGPIPQVNVHVKGTDTNTITDFDGKFTIKNLDSKAILVFSYIGYLSQEVAVSGKTELLVKLKADMNNLNEVVIVGYASQKKKSITGAVVQVDMDELSKTKVADISQALQGQVAGVFVAANTGAPGDGIKLRIRGEGTLGKNDVLYIIDGTPTRDITFLNPSDVKTITILKDAAAGAIYGSRASAGVVVITTKLGTSGKPTLDVDMYTGMHFATNLPKMLNTSQYMDVKEQAWNNSFISTTGIPNPYTEDRSTKTFADTDWQDELFTTGISRNFQLSASGATENVQYLISGGYYGIDGIVVGKNDQYKRVNFRSNVNVNVSDRFSVGSNLQLSYASQDKLSSSGDVPGVIRHALIRPPVLGVYKDVNDPTYRENDPYTDLPFYTSSNEQDGWSKNYELSSNPLAIVHFTDDKRNTFQTFGNVYAEYSLLSDKSLKFRSNLGVDVKFSHNKSFKENYGDPNVSSPTTQYYLLGRNNKPNGLDEDRGQDVTFTWSNTLNYVKTLGDSHSLNLLLGVENIKNKAAGVGASRQNYDNTTDSFRYLEFGSLGDARNTGTETSWALLSYFASGTYGYKDKYFATATIRADASSKFGPNKKWGYFPSVSAGWIVSNEDFMKDVNWLSNLKFRASWGEAGNQELPNFAYETLVSSSGGIVNIVRYGNPDLKWETTTQTNFGIDFSILKDKLSFSADYFKKTTSDILLTMQLPAVSVGVIDRTYVNAGEVVNKGFEFGVNFQNSDNEFKYGINANIATLDNEVTKLHANVRSLEDGFTHTNTVVGQGVNSYYGLQFDGIYQNANEVSSHLFSDAGSTKPGDMKFKDINEDGTINADDRTFLGSPIPEITYGLSFNASYKNFDVSFMFQGVEGVDVYNDLKQILDYDSRPFNSTTAVLNSWNGEGTSNTQPRLTRDGNGGGQVSSAFVEDASYLRLKNLEIGYTFNKTLPRLNSLRLYVSGQNLLTWTDYKGLDPESTSLIDKGTYPQSTAVIFGVRVKL